jgi:retron-type reverse transcriptase
MTTGVTAETVDAMSLAKIETIITALRDGTFHWHPVRRVSLPKRKGRKMRPLGLPDWSAKLVQEVIRMILEAYYEPRFSDTRMAFGLNAGAIRRCERYRASGQEPSGS